MFSSEQTRVRVMASAGLVLCLLLSGFSLTSAQISESSTCVWCVSLAGAFYNVCNTCYGFSLHVVV